MKQNRSDSRRSYDIDIVKMLAELRQVFELWQKAATLVVSVRTLLSEFQRRKLVVPATWEETKKYGWHQLTKAVGRRELDQPGDSPDGEGDARHVPRTRAWTMRLSELRFRIPTSAIPNAAAA